MSRFALCTPPSAPKSKIVAPNLKDFAPSFSCLVSTIKHLAVDEKPISGDDNNLFVGSVCRFFIEAQIQILLKRNKAKQQRPSDCNAR